MYTLCGNNCQVVGRLAAATLLAALDSDACCTLCREPSATVGGIVVQYMYVHVCAQAARKDLAALDSAAPPPRTSALGQHNAPSHTRSSATPKQSSLHRRNGYRRRPSASRTRRVAPWPAALQPARRRLPGSQERARRTNCRLRHGTWTKVICMGHVARVARVGILSTSSGGRFACAAVTWTVHPPQTAAAAHGWPCPHAVAIRASAPAVRVMVGQKEGGERARQVGTLRAGVL